MDAFSKPLPLRTNTASSMESLSSSSSASSPSPSSPTSPSSPRTAKARRANLSLDLSSLPPLQPPAAPTNTLLFTNLQHPDVFRPDNLQTIRDLVEHTAPLHSWAPLRSFRRIVASFHSSEDAARVRAIWEGERVLGEPCQVYFGRPTPLDAGNPAQIQHLELPDAGKLFFISPPPSPPHGWEMRLEGAPNKQVHADDLAEALAKLHHQAAMPGDDDDVMADVAIPSPVECAVVRGGPRGTRSRSSTLIYQPADHGSHPDLPAIAVEDLTDEPEELADPVFYASPVERPIMAHTQRPPVELMNDA